MNFIEAYRLPESRYTRFPYIVIDNNAMGHAFTTANAANVEFPGAFDPHPDYADDIA